jgi:hypothetical protein
MSRGIQDLPSKRKGVLDPNAPLPYCPERQIESRLVALAKRSGGLALKWTSPAFAGVPDRIVFHGQGRVTLVELKATGKKPTALQCRVHDRLRALGMDVRVVDSYGGVDDLFA